MEVDRRPIVVIGPREAEHKNSKSFSIESILEKKEDKDEFKLNPSAFRQCKTFHKDESSKWFNSTAEYREAHQTCPPPSPSPSCPFACCSSSLVPSSTYGLCLQRDAYYRMHGALSRSLSNTISYGTSNYDPPAAYRFGGPRGNLSPYAYSSYKRLLTEERDDSKRKGGQVRFSHVQSVELERVFNHQKYISPQERKQLSRMLHLSERQVKTWFQNRRAKWRRIKMEAEMKRRLARDCILREQLNKSSEKTVKNNQFERQDKEYYYTNKINGRKMQDYDVEELNLSPERD